MVMGLGIVDSITDDNWSLSIGHYLLLAASCQRRDGSGASAPLSAGGASASDIDLAVEHLGDVDGAAAHGPGG